MITAKDYCNTNEYRSIIHINELHMFYSRIGGNHDHVFIPSYS